MDFQQAENQYRMLADQVNRGQIPYDQFVNAVNQITVYDQSGQLWMIHAQSGKWCTFTGGQWVFQEPAKPGAPPQIPSPQILSPVFLQPAQQPRKKSALIIILPVVIVLCLGLTITGIFLAKKGILSSILPNLPVGSGNNASQTTGNFQVNPINSVTVVPGESLVVDSNNAQLFIPEGSLPEGVGGQFILNEPNSMLKKEIEKLATLVTPFYQLQADGENDGTGNATLSIPTTGQPLFLVELFDGKYIAASRIPYSGSIAEISVPLLSGKSDPGDKSMSFNGTYAFALITPKSSSSYQPSIHMASFSSSNDERDCTIYQQIASSGYGIEEIKKPVSFCRKNANDTIRVMYNTTYTPNVTPDLADQAVDLVQKVMSSYQSEGFDAADLVKNGYKVNVVIEAGSGDPVYTPSNGSVYIPQDSMGKDNLASELAHELAHWIQDAAYNMTSSYWSDKLGISSASKWWLENSAEYMVMLYDPKYIDQNLISYGTTSLGNDKRVPFQLAPNQWNDDLYLHAQLLKVFTCDNPSACPISPKQFIEAINKGTFPIDATAVEKISANLDDFARYLLGKSPQKANSMIYLLNSVKNGTGYGESVTPVDNKGELNFKKTGYEPQMKPTSGDTGPELDIQAVIEQGGVYPLMLETSRNTDLAGYPVEIEVSPGTPFYYTEDGGEIQYNDGTAKAIIGPLHPKTGLSSIRIVAVATDGAKTFTARIHAIDISGDWIFGYDGIVTNNLVCESTDKDDSMSPEEMASLTAYLNSYVPTVAGSYVRDTGTNTYTWTLSPGADLSFGSDTTAVVNGAALLDSKGITIQSFVSIPQAKSRLPGNKEFPAVMASALFLVIPLILRKNKRAFLISVIVAMLLISGCSGFFFMYGDSTTSTVVDKLLPATLENLTKLFGDGANAQIEEYSPRYIATGTTTADVNWTIGGGAATIEGESESSTTCTGTITYKVKGFLIDDGVITDFPNND
jgi:hypothetical protein